ncbi:two-component sensor histidine kinase [Candidatus Magnetoovum chiemensis]|nr:two-component sensor histidine kinase [Candidatus Magnetoovum chiemensis]
MENSNKKDSVYSKELPSYSLRAFFLSIPVFIIIFIGFLYYLSYNQIDRTSFNALLISASFILTIGVFLSSIFAAIIVGVYTRPIRDVLSSLINFQKGHYSVERELEKNEILSIEFGALAAAVRETEENLAKQAIFSAMNTDIAIAVSASDSVKDMFKRCSWILSKYLGSVSTCFCMNRAEKSKRPGGASDIIYSDKDDFYQAILMQKFDLCSIALKNAFYITNDVMNDKHVIDTHWARREKIASYAAYPISYKNKLTGTMVVFFRIPCDKDTVEAINSSANLIAAGIKDKLDKNELIKETLSLKKLNKYLENRLLEEIKKSKKPT